MPLWSETPLIFSNLLSQKLEANVYLKLENFHPSQSFKYRGISLFAERAKKGRGDDVHLVVASGGNAGLAVACASRQLGVKCTVFIPSGVTEHTLKILYREGADVQVVGNVYAEALQGAQKTVDQSKNAILVPAYDHELLWEGHSSMIQEIARQLPKRPDAIFCSIGGGGLLGGVIIGCEKQGWDDVPIVGVETMGSDCFHYSVALNRQENTVLPPTVDALVDDLTGLKLAHFSTFTSRAAGSLGASQPAPRVLQLALQRKGGIRSVTVADHLSMNAAVQFAEDHKLIVELACSTTLTAGYSPGLLRAILPELKSQATLVFIVCGGFKATLEDLVEYRQLLSETPTRNSKEWNILQ